MKTSTLMRRINQGLIILAFVALLIFLGYLGYRFVLPRWVPIAFYAYLALGLFLQVAGVLVLYREFKKAHSIKDTIINSFEQAKERRQLLTRLREAAAHTSGFLEIILVWPANAVADFDLAFIRRRIREEPIQIKEYVVSQSLRFKDLHHSTFALVMTLITYAIAIGGVRRQDYFRAFITIMGASVVLRHIRYSVTTQSLPTSLRRLSASPYVVFILIAVCDFLTLTFSFAVISADALPSALTWQHLSATAIGLYRFRELAGILSGEVLSFTQIMTGMAGLLFYLALLRIAMRFRDFRRDDDDYHWLAARQNLLGDFNAALRYLRRVEERTMTTGWHTIMALIGLNEVERAAHQAELYLGLLGAPATNQNVFAVMYRVCLHGPIPDDSVVSLIRYGIQHEVADLSLQDAVNVLGLNSQSLVEPLSRVVSPVESKYPLTSAALMITADNTAGAIVLLDKATPGSELEEITRLVMRLRASLEDPNTTDEEDAETLRRWIESTFPTVRELLPSISQATDIVIAFGQLAALKVHAANLGEERLKGQITFLLGDLKEKVSGESDAEFLVKSIEYRLDSAIKEHSR